MKKNLSFFIGVLLVPAWLGGMEDFSLSSEEDDLEPILTTLISPSPKPAPSFPMPSLKSICSTFIYDRISNLPQEGEAKSHPLAQKFSCLPFDLQWEVVREAHMRRASKNMFEAPPSFTSPSAISLQKIYELCHVSNCDIFSDMSHLPFDILADLDIEYSVEIDGKEDLEYEIFGNFIPSNYPVFIDRVKAIPYSSLERLNYMAEAGYDSTFQARENLKRYGLFCAGQKNLNIYDSTFLLHWLLTLTLTQEELSSLLPSRLETFHAFAQGLTPENFSHLPAEGISLILDALVTLEKKMWDHGIDNCDVRSLLLKITQNFDFNAYRVLKEKCEEKQAKLKKAKLNSKPRSPRREQAPIKRLETELTKLQKKRRALTFLYEKMGGIVLEYAFEAGWGSSWRDPLENFLNQLQVPSLGAAEFSFIKMALSSSNPFRTQFIEGKLADLFFRTDQPLPVLRKLSHCFFKNQLPFNSFSNVSAKDLETFYQRTGFLKKKGKKNKDGPNIEILKILSLLEPVNLTIVNRLLRGYGHLKNKNYPIDNLYDLLCISLDLLKKIESTAHSLEEKKSIKNEIYKTFTRVIPSSSKKKKRKASFLPSLSWLSGALEQAPSLAQRNRCIQEVLLHGEAHPWILTLLLNEK